MNSSNSYSNKTVLVTGASGNLGKSVTAALLESGFAVIGVGRKTPSPGVLPQEVDFLSADLTSQAEVADLFHTLESRYQHLIHGVFLAGGFQPGDLKSTDKQLFMNSLEINFVSSLLPAAAMCRLLQKQGRGGKLLFTGSGPGIQPELAVGAVAYGLSKSLLHYLSGIINADENCGIKSAVMVLPTLDTPTNRAAMPNADFSSWTKTEMVGLTVSRYLSGDISGDVIVP